jgi:hypothetical protein
MPVLSQERGLYVRERIHVQVLGGEMVERASGAKNSQAIVFKSISDAQNRA